MFADAEARAAGRREAATLLVCTTCWGYTCDRNGRGLTEGCPGRPIASAKNNRSAIESQFRHPKMGRALLGELRCPQLAEGYWADRFVVFRESGDGPGGSEGRPPVGSRPGPCRPSLASVLATFGLDVPRAKELGASVAAARALRDREAADREQARA